jgi:L-seryl-tRNA(Ser) seleniumtransferase
MGKKELIAAARLNGPPGGGNIGRGMKVNKEEILGMYVALDSYIKRDHAQDWKTWESQIDVVRNALKNIKGVTTEVILPPVANHTPSLEITWEKSKVKSSRDELVKNLRNGSPCIEVIGWEKEDSIRITVFMLKAGQEKIVAKRIQEELLKVSA